MYLGRSCSGFAVLLVLLAGGHAVGAPAQQPANPWALALKQFDERIANYVAIRDKAAAGLPKIKETDDPAQINARQKQLAEAIRAARPAAKPGDLFAPAAAILRDLVRDDFRERPLSERKKVLGEIPENAEVQVNRLYPSVLPLATVPPKLLARLPRLPDGVEYRLVGRALILRDRDPNLVIDVLPGAVPASSGRGPGPADGKPRPPSPQ